VKISERMGLLMGQLTLPPELKRSDIEDDAVLIGVYFFNFGGAALRQPKNHTMKFSTVTMIN
jgi:hypothetical protein